MHSSAIAGGDGEMNVLWGFLITVGATAVAVAAMLFVAARLREATSPTAIAPRVYSG